MVAKSLVLVDEPLYIYIRRQGSTTTTTTRKNLIDQIYVLDKWENILKQAPNDARARVVWGSLAKQYCSALIIYAKVDDAKDLLPQLLHKKHLLQYSNNKRVIIFRKAVKLVGIKGLIYGLKFVQKIR